MRTQSQGIIYDENYKYIINDQTKIIISRTKCEKPTCKLSNVYDMI